MINGRWKERTAGLLWFDFRLLGQRWKMESLWIPSFWKRRSSSCRRLLGPEVMRVCTNVLIANTRTPTRTSWARCTMRVFPLHTVCRDIATNRTLSTFRRVRAEDYCLRSQILFLMELPCSRVMMSHPTVEFTSYSLVFLLIVFLIHGWKRFR